tara:strand:+ start:818 stop:1054 length:237 start_codon:yes stop_codon:yes gene_type:complete
LAVEGTGGSWTLHADYDQVQRVLKDDGVFLYVTYRQPHFIKPILNRNNEWNLRMEEMGGGDSFQYFGFALKKNAETAR